MMENKVMMTFGRAYEAPDVQVMEVLVEQGFQNSLENELNAAVLNYDDDFDDFAY